MLHTESVQTLHGRITCMESMRLLSGNEMPVVGLGTWPLKGDQCKKVLKEALGLGYTHIDTAWIYDNHREIGEYLQDTQVSRGDLFITSKIGKDYVSYDDTMVQIDEILTDLQMDYVDLLLIHWPSDSVPMEETFRAFNEIHAAGKALSVGVSNFSVDQMEQANALSNAPVCVNQIKYHPSHEQREVLHWCQQRDTIVTAYSPLGKDRILDDPILGEIAGNHEKTAAHVCLKWLRQLGMIVIPKASSREHLEANLEVFDWNLSEEEMSRISAMYDA